MLANSLIHRLEATAGSDKPHDSNSVLPFSIMHELYNGNIHFYLLLRNFDSLRKLSYRYLDGNVQIFYIYRLILHIEFAIVGESYTIKR